MATFHENLVQSFHNFRDKYLKANGNFFKFSYDATTQKYGFTINGTFHPFKTVQASKTVTAGTSAQTVTPDSGYDGVASVTVNPQVHSGTYKPTARSTALDMGTNHNNRYVNTSEVEANSQTGGIIIDFYNSGDTPRFAVSGMGGFTKGDWYSLPNYAANDLVGGTKTYSLDNVFDLEIIYDSTNRVVTSVKLYNRTGVTLDGFRFAQYNYPANGDVTSTSYGNFGKIANSHITANESTSLILGGYNITMKEAHNYRTAGVLLYRCWKR